MNRMIKMTAFASGLALASLAASHFAVADSKRQCLECLLGGGGAGGGAPEPGAQNGQDQDFLPPPVKRLEQPNTPLGDQQYIPRKRARTFEPNDQFQQGGGDEQYIPRKRKKTFEPNDQVQQGGGDDNFLKKRPRGTKQAWRYDSNRHERRRHKDKRFRYYFEGFWYPQAYWYEPYYYDDYISRVSCREGAEIVSERFNRVRIVECDGRVYTYVGRRHGDTFEIKLSARTGRIIDAEEI